MYLDNFTFLARCPLGVLSVRPCQGRPNDCRLPILAVAVYLPAGNAAGDSVR